MTRTISHFLLLFQLTFCLPEKAMHTLLHFLRALFSFLSSLCQGSLLAELSISLPRSLYGVRRYLERTNKWIHPICSMSSLCQNHIEDCILNIRGHKESRLCDYIEFPQHPHANKRAKCNTTLMKTLKLEGRINWFLERLSCIAVSSKLFRWWWLNEGLSWISVNNGEVGTLIITLWGTFTMERFIMCHKDLSYNFLETCVLLST